MDILRAVNWTDSISEMERVSDSDDVNTINGSLTEEEETSFSLLRMTREQRGFLKFEIAPILNNFVFKIFFFILATSLVFLVSVLTAFVVMRLVDYVISLIQVRCNGMNLNNSHLKSNFCLTVQGRLLCPGEVYKREASPPSYSSVVRRDNKGLPTYAQVCHL